MIIFIVLGIIAVLAAFIWAMRQRGGKSYYLAVAYTAASFIVSLGSLHIIEGNAVGSSEPNSINSYFDGMLRLSLIFYPINLLITVFLYQVEMHFGAKDIPEETTSKEVDKKKWGLYVLINGVVVNGILYCVLSLAEKQSIYAFAVSTVLIILHYPILCKLDRWWKKSLVLVVTMMLYFSFILESDGNSMEMSDIGILAFGSIMAFIAGSMYLMSIIWMNYALRKRLFCFTN